MEDDGHYEEVQQEALGGVRTVKVEKDEREEQSEELEAGVAEGRAQELQPGDRRQEDVTAGGREESSDDTRTLQINRCDADALAAPLTGSPASCGG